MDCSAIPCIVFSEREREGKAPNESRCEAEMVTCRLISIFLLFLYFFWQSTRVLGGWRLVTTHIKPFLVQNAFNLCNA